MPSSHCNADLGGSIAHKRSYALLLIVACATGMGQTVVFAIVPPLARTIELRESLVGLIFSFSAFCWVVSTPRWGNLSDRIGRKPLILIGVFGFVASMVSFALVWQAAITGALSDTLLILALIGSRAIYGVVGAAGPSSAQAYIADRTTATERTAGIARYSAAFAFGAIFGPGFGATVALLSPTAPFLVLALIGVALWPILLFRLPEHTPPKRRSARCSIRLTDNRIRMYLVYGLGMGVINAIPLQTAAFYFLDRLGYSIEFAPQIAGVGLMASAMCSLSAQLVVVQKFRLSPRALMRAAPILIIFGNLLIWATSNPGPVIFGLMLTGFGAGMAIPGFIGAVSISVPHRKQGSAIALANSAGAAGQIVSPLIALTLYESSPQHPYLFSLALAVVLLIFVWRTKSISAAVPSHVDEDVDPPPPNFG